MTKSKRAARARAKKKQLTRARILRAEGRSKGKKNYAKINVTTAAGGRYESAPAVENRGKSGDGEEDRSKESKKSSGPFESFGEQLQQIMRADSHGGPVDPRLIEVRAATLEQSVELLAHGQRAPVEVKGK